MRTLPVGNKNENLQARAGALFQDLAKLPATKLSERLSSHLNHFNGTERPWWTNATSEPHAVTIALELIHQDHQAGEMAAPKALDYFTAARAAVKGVPS